MWTDAMRAKYAHDNRRYPSDLTDAEWESVRPHLGKYSPLTADLREIVNACLYMAKTGVQWRYLPTDFGARGTVREYWDRFHRDGVWETIGAALSPKAREALGRPSEPRTGLLDAQTVSAAPQGGPRGVDGSKKRNGIKRHLLTCSAGLVMAVVATAANVHDSRPAASLLGKALAAFPTLERVVADGAYGGAPLRTAFGGHGVDLQITAKPEGAKGFVPQPVRWRVEATNGTLSNRFRRLAKHWEASTGAAENLVMVANVRRSLSAISRSGQV